MLKNYATINPIKIPVSPLVLILTLLFISAVQAHGVDANTQQFLQANHGVAIGPFLYIGAKHMVTGYDHLLFLLGVIFFYFVPGIFWCMSVYSL